MYISGQKVNKLGIEKKDLVLSENSYGKLQTLWQATNYFQHYITKKPNLYRIKNRNSEGGNT
jgi:peptide methionine sulfoxide reductase MsrA